MSGGVITSGAMKSVQADAWQAVTVFKVECEVKEWAGLMLPFLAISNDITTTVVSRVYMQAKHNL